MVTSYASDTCLSSECGPSAKITRRVTRCRPQAMQMARSDGTRDRSMLRCEWPTHRQAWECTHGNEASQLTERLLLKTYGTWGN